MTFEQWMDSQGIKYPSETQKKLLKKAFKAGQESINLRDIFAGQALQGILAGRNPDGFIPDDIAYFAYKYADDMLHEREAK